MCLRRLLSCLLLLALCPATGWATRAAPAQAQADAPVPPLRITARDLGLVINTADPYSVAVGAYYEQRRGIPARQVLRIELPMRARLTPDEFASLAREVQAFMGPQVQALALAWTQPFAVQCNSITSALTLGYQGDLCQDSCAASRTSALFSSVTARPFRDYGLRPSMLLASRDVAAAKALIERGIASDHSLAGPGAPVAHAVFVNTRDQARNVRAPLFPPAGPVAGSNVTVLVRAVDDPQPLRRVVLYQTGLARVGPMDSAQWLPGALADHLTSSGGQLPDGAGQTSVLDWLEGGATASYGAVSEPCNHVAKFPHPAVLLAQYMQGASALEAYWRSVAWPAQGVFVGEPLAAPFALPDRPQPAAQAER